VIRETEPGAAGLVDAVEREGPAAVASRLSPDMLRRHGIEQGEDVHNRLAEWRAAGVDLPVLWPVGPGAHDFGWLETL
jgi:hypothetical protein